MFLITRRKKKQRPPLTNLAQQSYYGIRIYSMPANLLPFTIAWFIISTGLLVYAFQQNSNLFTLMIEYTQCFDSSQTNCYDKDMLTNNNCICEVQFDTALDLNLPLYFSYGLSGYYQNHLAFFRSYDPLQLNGNIPAIPITDCGQFRQNSDNAYILPCGTVANSMFNDSFELKQGKVNIPLTTVGAPAYIGNKFKNPDEIIDGIKIYDMFARPISWKKNISELGSGSQKGFLDPDFINWMIISPLSKFIKPFRVLNDFQGEKVLPAGSYKIVVNYNYPVKVIDAKKFIVISQPSKSFGNKNTHIIYSLIVSIFCTLIISAMGIYEYCFP